MAMIRDQTGRCWPEPPAGRPSASWRVVGAGAGLAGTEGITEYLHPALGQVLVTADVIAPAAIALLLLAFILFGSKEKEERVFRLLRWLTNRPEPPAPAPQGPGRSSRLIASGTQTNDRRPKRAALRGLAGEGDRA
jgi:hypothetical protein